MKQINTRNKIILIISSLLVIAGIIVVALVGFNVERKYQSYNKITIYVGEEIELEKVRQEITDIFGENRATVQMVELYNEAFQVTAKEITEEQKNAVVNKINELYPVQTEDNDTTDTAENSDNTEDTTEQNVRVNSEDVEILSASNIRLRDLYKPYVMPFIAVTLVILAYIAFRYRKIGIIKAMLQTGGILLYVQILLLSILAIIRFPMGRLTPAIIMLAYMLSILYISNKWKNAK